MTINTDNRLMSDVTLSHEYRGLVTTRRWGHADFLRTNQTAIAAAFCDEDTRRQVRAKLDSRTDPDS